MAPSQLVAEQANSMVRGQDYWPQESLGAEEINFVNVFNDYTINMIYTEKLPVSYNAIIATISE